MLCLFFSKTNKIFMRLTQKQIEAVVETFYEHFLPEDSIYLFGSRVDDSRRGGDIDLYAETNYEDSEIAYKKARDFRIMLERKLGEQKIDFIVNRLKANRVKSIYTEAKETGIKLEIKTRTPKKKPTMKKQQFLLDYIRIADLHAKRLSYALDEAKDFLPLTADKMAKLSDKQISITDMAINRFSKLQDVIGSKIFPLFLELMGEQVGFFIDNLNKLEKHEYLDDANWWKDLRDKRNEITHDYPDDYKTLSDHFNEMVAYADQLLEYWQGLKEKLRRFE